MKAIETVYNGYRFRSRLEARWAVFFDTLGVPYQYEPEGFDLGEAGWYLPDFYLPQQKYWIEVKPCVGDIEDWPEHPMFDYLRNIIRSWEAMPEAMPMEWIPGSPSPNTFFILVGEPYVDYQYGMDDEWHYNGFILGDHHYRWCECPSCGLIGLKFEARADRLPCKECARCQHYRIAKNWKRAPAQPCPEHGIEAPFTGCPRDTGDRGHNGASARLLAAYTAARQARFEHGEHGRPT